MEGRGEVKFTIYVVLFLAYPCMALDYKSFVDNQGKIEPALLDNAIRDTVEKVNDMDYKKVPYTVYNASMTNLVPHSIFDSSMTILLGNASAQATYTNVEQFRSSMTAIQNQRTLFATNGTNTGNIVFAYQRNQLTGGSPATIINTTGATHHNILFMGAVCDDDTNTVGFSYDSASNLYELSVNLTDSTDNWSVGFDVNWANHWVNIFVAYTLTAY